MLSDTHPEAARVQLELLRRASPAKRFALACSLTDTVLSLCRRALAEANPGLSKDKLDLLFVELNYGRELAERVRVFQQERETKDYSNATGEAEI